ncbi:chaplin [Streptomyces sp. PT12]|uniref:chaplin n=1 Tax=Streptomyces sp. PT12 TaxID=1510197 RepID=UPI000DE4FF7C|nr:chaplin [Streptomyces sp. PT12]RBM12370.1 chaplin [Streptomyces sp. PT12]
MNPTHHKSRNLAATAGLGVALAVMCVGPAVANSHGEKGETGNGGEPGAAHGCLHKDDAQAAGGAAFSPGLASGNLVQVPVQVPINLCGNSLNVIGFGNAVFGN